MAKRYYIGTTLFEKQSKQRLSANWIVAPTEMMTEHATLRSNGRHPSQFKLRAYYGPKKKSATFEVGEDGHPRGIKEQL